MRLRTKLKPFVPPILWSALSRLKAKRQVRKSGRKRSVARLLPGGEFTVLFTKVIQDHGTYFVPDYAQHRPASRAILGGGLYEPATHDLIHRILQRKPGSIVHAGTFFGDMLPTFSRSCPATVYAFEPVLENYLLAKLCMEANRLENVFLQNAGLSEKTSTAYVDTGSDGEPHRGGSSRLSDHGQRAGLLAIDGLGLSDVAIIQLDVEGHELPALQGARDTIERNGPIIMVEDNSRTCNAFLEAMEYRYICAIPGLLIWARPDDWALIEALTSETQAS